jgi:DNA-directed RNA polymerase subunit RPC12/RpoP
MSFVYVWFCEDCKKSFDTNTYIKTPCPHCGKKVNVNRMWSNTVPEIHFKGTGWTGAGTERR